MDITDTIVQKITDLLLWDDVTKPQQYCIVESNNSVVFSRVNGKETADQKTLYIIENRCGDAGIHEVEKITTHLDWEGLSAFIFITANIAEVKKVAKKVPVSLQCQCDLYGVDPDYFFSLVPLEGANHKRIESFIVSLKSIALFKEKIKYLIKKILILFNFSTYLYERYVYCVCCDKPQG